MSILQHIDNLFVYYTATSPGRRFLCLLNKYPLWNKEGAKKLVIGYTRRFRKNGKNIHRTRSGGGKYLYRAIDFRRRSNTGIPASLLRIEYDAMRSSFICLILYSNNIVSYIVYPSKLALGATILNSLAYVSFLPLRIGDCCPIFHFTRGVVLHNLEAFPGSGAHYLRAAGMYGTMLRKVVGFSGALIRLRVGIRRFFPRTLLSAVGIVSAVGHRHRILAKAGRARLFGKRPIVRGVARNPIDHAHGGGAGRKKRIPRTLWGKQLKWKRTRRRSFFF